jgi:hypothetical protein
MRSTCCAFHSAVDVIRSFTLVENWPIRVNEFYGDVTPIGSSVGNLAKHQQRLRLPAEVIVRSKAAPLFAVLIVAFVYMSLFCRRIPPSIQSALFFVVLLLEIAMIAAGWWFYIKNRKANGVANWRKRIALLGVMANTTAFAIPVVSLVYMIFYPYIALRLRLPMIDGEKMVLACLVFSLCGLIAGILAPARSRFATALGSLIIALLVLAIPMGIL